MAFISKYDLRFLTFMNRKYKTYNVAFEFYDDYVLWLYDLCNNNEIEYYKQLEKDLWEYVDFQNGKEREKRGRLDSRWDND